MKLKTKPHSDATYPIVAERIIGKIKSGEYRLGEKLSARAIAAELNIGRRIASSALDTLVINGVVTVEPRKGFFVSEKFALRNKSKIGIFVCEMTPLISGPMLNKTFHECLRRDYELLYGSDWDQRGTLKDFLLRNPEISGLLVHGFVEEYALKPLKKWGKPYLVMGCHNISAQHPSEEANLLEDMSVTLTAAFRKFSGKRIAGMLGDRDSASDCKVMQALRLAIKNVGSPISDELQLHADGNVYSRMLKMLTKTKPDVIFALGIFQVAIAQVLRSHPEVKKPYIIGEKITMSEHLPEVCDEYVALADYNGIIIQNSVRRIIEMIEGK